MVPSSEPCPVKYLWTHFFKWTQENVGGQHNDLAQRPWWKALTSITACLWLPIRAPAWPIHHTVRTCPLRGAAAVVGIDPIHTNPSVLTPVVRAVINIPLTGAAFKTWWERARENDEFSAEEMISLFPQDTVIEQPYFTISVQQPAAAQPRTHSINKSPQSSAFSCLQHS